MQNSNERWQSDINGVIYESSFDELVQWIAEGALLPQDKVRRGNLRWIYAGKVPALMTFFNAQEQGLAMPVAVTTTESSQIENQFAAPQHFSSDQENAVSNPYQTTIVSQTASFDQSAQNTFHEQSFSQSKTSESQPQFEPPAAIETFHPQNDFQSTQLGETCSLHPELESAYYCGTCGNGFCKLCPKSYGGTVKICPFCGAMCKSVKEVSEKVQAAAQFEYDVSKGFGFDDFFTALAYPFKFKASLIFGAFMYMLFTLGQSATAMGGIIMASSALVCWMMANTLSFGVLSNTINNFSQGKIGTNFMPNFDEFSIWDDVVHPFFLSLGVYIVSFGLAFLIILISVFWGLNQMSKAITDSYNKDQQSTRILTDKNSPINNNPTFSKQKQLYGDGKMPDEDQLNQPPPNELNPDEQNRRTEQWIKEYEQKRLESEIGKSAETQQKEQAQLLSGFFGFGAPFMILIGLGLVWGFFYLPAACCVAGYTRSFVATLNPTIGLETIKILGWDYMKIWLMGFVITVFTGMVGFLLGMFLSPLDLPQIGNLPVKIIGALITFYFTIVFSVILGLALYKNTDKLNLFKG